MKNSPADQPEFVTEKVRIGFDHPELMIIVDLQVIILKNFRKNLTFNILGCKFILNNPMI